MNKIYLIILFFSCFVGSWSQKVIVLLEVEPSIVSPNEEITVKVTYNISGELEVKWPDQFNRNYSTMRGSKIMNDYTTGEFIQQNYVSYSGSFSNSGSFTIGPAYIKKGNKIYKSNSVNVTVRNENIGNPIQPGDISSKQLNDDAFGIIATSKSTVYEGEPIVLEAKIYSKFNPTLLESYKSYVVNGISEKQDLQKSSNNITVKEDYIKNRAYYAFGYDKKVLFLNGAGEKEISPFELTLHYGFQTKKVESSGAKITVKPLPDGAPTSFTGGVGTFSIKRIGITKNLKQGDVFPMVIEISGTGNLQQISKPTLDLGKNFTLYGDPIIKEDFEYSALGAEGKITITYNLQVVGNGKVKLPEVQFAYFDPQVAKYIDLKAGSEELNVAENSNFKLSQTTSGKSENFKGSNLNGSSDASNFIGELSSSPLIWGLTALPFLLGLMWYFRIRKNENPRTKEINDDLHTTNDNTIDVIEPNITELKEEVDLNTLLLNGETLLFYKEIKQKIINELTNKLGQLDDVHPSVVFEEAQSILPDDTNKEINRIIDACEQGQFGMGLSSEENHNLLSATNRLLDQIHI
jgi:hypothetical protein